MAGVLVTTIKRFIGTAAEIAAISLTDVPAGSTAYETDTGIMKIVGADGTLKTKQDQVKLIAGTELAGKVGIDQATAHANEVVTKTGSKVGIEGTYTTGTAIGNDNAVTFANNAAANTQVDVDIVKPTSPKNRYFVAVYNPSTVSDLTCKVFAKMLTLGADTRYALIDTLTIPKAQTVTGTAINTYLKLIEGVFAGADLRLTFSNDTILGAANGFSAYVRVGEVL